MTGNIAGDPALWHKVAGMLTARPEPTLEIGTTFTGDAYVRIVEASRGRGRKRETFLVVAPTLADVFRVCAAALGADVSDTP